MRVLPLLVCKPRNCHTHSIKDEPIFNEEESAKLQSGLGVEPQDLMLLVDTSSFFFQQVPYNYRHMYVYMYHLYMCMCRQLII